MNVADQELVDKIREVTRDVEYLEEGVILHTNNYDLVFIDTEGNIRVCEHTKVSIPRCGEMSCWNYVGKSQDWRK